MDTVNAVIYARFSSAGQREESIEGQIRVCSEYAKRNGMVVVGTYCDRAISGKTDARPEFQKMVRDSAKDKFEVVLVWKLDRFARNRYDSAIYKARLKQNGVRLISTEEHIPEGAEGIILEAVMEGYAEYYCANLSENVKRGNYESALKRLKMGGATLGLMRGPDGRWAINEEQAFIVRRIFRQYLEGVPAWSIVEQLNREGFKTARGQEFTKNSVRCIITNERYKGVYRYKDIVDPNGIPAIIDPETWEKAQTVRAVIAKAPASKKSVEGGWLLTGKIFCGECGAPMQCDGGTSHTGKVYEYYTCTERKAKRCKKKRITKTEAEETVVKALVEIIHKDEVIDQIADAYMEWQARQEVPDDIRFLEAHLSEISAKRKNIISLCEQGLGTPELIARLNELRDEEAAANEELQVAKFNAIPQISREDIVRFLLGFKEGNIHNYKYRLKLVDTFLHAVWFFDDRPPILQLNYTGTDGDVDIKAFLEGKESSNLVCFSPLCYPNLNLLLFGAVLMAVIRDK